MCTVQVPSSMHARKGYGYDIWVWPKVIDHKLVPDCRGDRDLVSLHFLTSHDIECDDFMKILAAIILQRH